MTGITRKSYCLENHDYQLNPVTLWLWKVIFCGTRKAQKRFDRSLQAEMCKQAQKATEQFHFISERAKKAKRHKIVLFVISKANVPPFVPCLQRRKDSDRERPKERNFNSLFSLAAFFFFPFRNNSPQYLFNAHFMLLRYNSRCCV